MRQFCGHDHAYSSPLTSSRRVRQRDCCQVCRKCTNAYTYRSFAFQSHVAHSLLRPAPSSYSVSNSATTRYSWLCEPRFALYVRIVQQSLVHHHNISAKYWTLPYEVLKTTVFQTMTVDVATKYTQPSGSEPQTLCRTSRNACAVQNNDKATKFAQVVDGCIGEAAIAEKWRQHFNQLYNTTSDNAQKCAFKIVLVVVCWMLRCQ